jgi:hypothetical protein
MVTEPALPTSNPTTPALNVRRMLYPLLAIGGLYLIGLLSLLFAGDLSQQSAGFYVGAMAVLFGLFGLALRWGLRLADSAQFLLIILVFAGLFRLVALFLAPTLSSDSFRYIWEGQLVTEGISPYRYAPTDQALSASAARSEIWALVQQRETASPYPPLSQLLGAAMYLLFGDNLLGPKISAAFFDCLVIAALLWLLKIYALPRNRVILYAWCPLPVIEFAGMGHNDVPMLLLLLVAIGLAARQRPLSSAVTLSLAGLAKFTALFGLPVFLAVWAKTPNWNFWTFLRSPRLWVYPALTVGLVVAGYVPFLIIGGGAIGSLLEYTGSWVDNEAPFYHYLYYTLGLTVAKGASLLALGLTALLVAFHPKIVAELSVPRRLSIILGVTLLVASTVHVWYLAWLFVLLPLVYGVEQNSFWRWYDWGWLAFGWLSQFSYLTYGGNLAHYQWIRWVEYLPLHVMLGYGLYVVYTRKV